MKLSLVAACAALCAAASPFPHTAEWEGGNAEGSVLTGRHPLQKKAMDAKAAKGKATTHHTKSKAHHVGKAAKHKAAKEHTSAAKEHKAKAGAKETVEEDVPTVGAASFNGQKLGWAFEKGSKFGSGGKFGDGYSRAYLVNSPAVAGQWDEVSFERVDLTGRILEFTMDLSHVGCSNIASVYLVAMPDEHKAKAINRMAWGWGARTQAMEGEDYDDDYEIDEYDESMVGFMAASPPGCPPAHEAHKGPPPKSGYCAIGASPHSCVELDIIEANTHAISSTMHAQTGHGSDGTCNAPGCGVNIGNSQRTPTEDAANVYGPGGRIDTKKPFKVNECPRRLVVRSTRRRRRRLVVSSHGLVFSFGRCAPSSTTTGS